MNVAVNVGVEVTFGGQLWAGRRVTAARTPRPTYTRPDNRSPSRSGVRRRRQRTPRYDASSAYAPSLSRPRAMKVSPSRTTCTNSGPRCGSRNGGRKARKNSAVLGLSTLTTTPWRNARPAEAGAPAASGVSAAPRPRRRRRPTTTRYAAPAYLTVVKAAAEETKIADSPAAAARTCATVPTCTPSTLARPTLRPCSRLCVTMYKTAGPGMTSKAIEAAAKRTKVEPVGTGRSSRVHPGRDSEFPVWQYGGSRRGTSAASCALGLLAGNERAT